MASSSSENQVGFNRKNIYKLPYNLEIGATHKGVLEAKKYLKHFDYAESKAFKVDSTFDEETRLALRQFQSWFTLDDTGLFDGPTKAALTSARCAHSRANPLAANTISKWDKKNLTYAYGPLSEDLPGDVCKAAVRRAFDTWQNAGVGLRFTEASAGATPDLHIDWRDALDEDLLKLDPEGNGMVGGTLAHADFLEAEVSLSKMALHRYHFTLMMRSTSGWTGRFQMRSISKLSLCTRSGIPSGCCIPTIQMRSWLPLLQTT